MGTHVTIAQWDQCHVSHMSCPCQHLALCYSTESETDEGARGAEFKSSVHGLPLPWCPLSASRSARNHNQMYTFRCPKNCV